MGEGEKGKFLGSCGSERRRWADAGILWDEQQDGAEQGGAGGCWSLTSPAELLEVMGRERVGKRVRAPPARAQWCGMAGEDQGLAFPSFLCD